MNTHPSTRHEILELARAYLARRLAIAALSATSDSAFAVSADEVIRAIVPAEAATGDDPISRVNAEHAPRIEAAHRALDTRLDHREEPRLGRLARTCSLRELDVVIVVLLMAPELDPSLERAYSFALDDFTKKRPDLGLIARLIGNTDEDLVDRVLARFDESAPLCAHGIVVVGIGDAPTALRPVRLADRIVAFLRGQDNVDALVRAHIRPGRPVWCADVVMEAELVARISRALQSVFPPRVLLAGPDGAGRCFVVEAIAAEARREVFRIDLGSNVADGMIAERMSSAFREVALRDAIAILDGSQLTDETTPRVLVHAIARAIESMAIPIVFAFNGHPGWLVRVASELVEIDIPAPTLRERRELWTRALGGNAAEADIEIVASRYGFTASTITIAAHRAVGAARARDPDRRMVTLDELGDAARLMFSHRLGTLAQRIPTGFSWSDLVVPKDTLDALKEVVDFARVKAFLLEDWGFSAKLPYGRGVSVILAGPPGTGKTMVAQILAKEIGFDLYRIDLSQIVNKYIGRVTRARAHHGRHAASAVATLGDRERRRAG